MHVLQTVDKRDIHQYRLLMNTKEMKLKSRNVLVVKKVTTKSIEICSWINDLVSVISVFISLSSDSQPNIFALMSNF